MGDGRHEPGQHRAGRFKTPHIGTDGTKPIVIKPKGKGIIARLIGKKDGK